MKHTASVLVLVLITLGTAQQSPTWESRQIRDAFRGTQLTEFRLEGKYLAAPTKYSSNPELLLHCIPASNTAGKNGKLAEAFLIAGDVRLAHSRSSKANASRVATQYRLDDGKIHTEYLYPSTDYKAVSLQPAGCGECVVNDFFYGHQISHKEGTSPQVRKVVVSIPELRGGEIVVQFDLPDVTEVAKACGVTYHK
jgi:hypothetical protein